MQDDFFMRCALEEARKAAEEGEVPIGAILVHNGQIIARGHNQVETSGDPTAHAEMLCIRQAAQCLGNWRLLDTTLYCTLEPCPMCAGAMIHARVKKLIFGAPDIRCGANGSWIDLFALKHPIHQLIVEQGVLAAECGDVLKSFFKKRRAARGSAF